MNPKFFRALSIALLTGLVLAGCATKSGYTVGPALPIPTSGQIPIK
jgi:hypothetical protein